jgi:AcrR family transcriptional regulator
MSTAITTDSVLDAAASLLRDGGADALTMRALASSLGVSYQVVYSRVGGKAELVRALHGRWFVELQATMAESDPTRPADLVHEVAQHYLAMAIADPIRFEVMFGSPIAEFVRDDAARGVEWSCFKKTWAAASSAWCTAHLDPNPSGAWLRLGWRLWTAVHGITSVHITGHQSPSGDPAAEVRSIVELILRATLVDPAHS